MVCECTNTDSGCIVAGVDILMAFVESKCTCIDDIPLPEEPNEEQRPIRKPGPEGYSELEAIEIAAKGLMKDDNEDKLGFCQVNYTITNPVFSTQNVTSLKVGGDIFPINPPLAPGAPPVSVQKLKIKPPADCETSRDGSVQFANGAAIGNLTVCKVM